MERFFVEACHMYGPQPGKRRWQYRIRDKDQCMPSFGAKVVAYTYDSETASRIHAVLNGNDTYVRHDRTATETARRNALALETRWQATLDHTNGLLREARAEADRLKTVIRELETQLKVCRQSLAGRDKFLSALEIERDELRNNQAKSTLLGPAHMVIPVSMYQSLTNAAKEARVMADELAELRGNPT
jgi:hypothetical protein